MEFKNIARVAIFLCLSSAVLSLNVKHGKHTGVKKSLEMEEAVMHAHRIYKRASTTAKESPRKGTTGIVADDNKDQILDDEFMRQMEMDDSDMHDPPKVKKSSGQRKGMDLDGIHPRPGVAGVPVEDEMQVADPDIRDSDLFSVLGHDILQQIEFDDSVMHPRSRRVAKQPRSSKPRAPEMDDSVMHPHHFIIDGQQKDITVMEPINYEDVKIPTELEEDFMQQFEIDDSLMHPDDVSGERKKSTYYTGKDKAGVQMHPKVAEASRHQQGTKDAEKGYDEDVEYGIDEVLGHDFMKRMELDDSGMHDPNWQPQEQSKSNSRRLLSLENGEDMDLARVLKEADDVPERRPHQMAVETKEKLGFFRQMNVGLGFPLHASCKLNWVFGVNCSSVSRALNQQIEKWNGPDNCKDGGEKCLYKLVSSNSTTLLATHETPVKHYVDDLSFQFTPKGSETCAVFGFSSSETWYAVLDKGTNYCNLHNLITGSGLDKTTGFKESTSDSVCTEYTSADCDVY